MKKLLFSLLASLYALSAFSQEACDYTYKGQTLSYEQARDESGNITWQVTGSETKYSGKVEIPEYIIYNGEKYSVTIIGDNAFRDWTGMTSVIIPNSVKEIYGFRYCTGLTSVSIPNSVTIIGSGAFRYCTRLTSVFIPNSVKKIYGFEGCTGLTSVSIPNSVTRLYGFEGCTGLTSVSIPNSVEYLGGFEGCTGLTSVSIPNSVKYLGGFKGCTGLTSVSIPNSVTRIDEYSFSQCRRLKTIYIQKNMNTNVLRDLQEIVKRHNENTDYTPAKIVYTQR